jgi:diadenosine tetraphosphate (Ap4A) HIT family hydrolase
MSCELCNQAGGIELWRDAAWRVVRVEDEAFPAFYRVIANAHVAEFTDLPAEQRAAGMELVARVERVLREHLAPTKMNIASLGNIVPHLHWHVIARFDWDSHFPQPIWGARQRDVVPPPRERLRLPLDRLDLAITQAL